MGKVLQSTKRDRFFRILCNDRRVILSLVRYYGLRITFSSHCPSFQHAPFFVYDTLIVKVFPSFYVVNSREYKIKRIPKFEIEKSSCLIVYSFLISFEVHWIIDYHTCFCSDNRLWFLNIPFSKQELSVKVWQFNIIIISHYKKAIIVTTNTHLSK